ncbi:unnamed protein product [Enterobius vermicularis]|uniref:Uncharacterized protein n=1 Tax=Enterobius vermicularis TaxID=51028 RepID=A0A0N4VGJ9_ENTVE|nr:unnamed protein product [Enterobius vermicularis]
MQLKTDLRKKPPPPPLRSNTSRSDDTGTDHIEQFNERFVATKYSSPQREARSLNSDAGPSTETNYQLKGHTSNAKTRGEETNRIFFTNATKDGIGAQNQNILNSFSQDRNIDKFIDDETETHTPIHYKRRTVRQEAVNGEVWNRMEEKIEIQKISD